VGLNTATISLAPALRSDWGEEIDMQLNGIESTLQQFVNQLPKELAPKDGPQPFQALMDALRNEIQAAVKAALATGSVATEGTPTTPVTTSPSASAPVAAAPAAAASAPTFRTTSQLTPFQ
jgi:lysozyme family protein